MIPRPSETSPITTAPAPSPKRTAVERSVKSVILDNLSAPTTRIFYNHLIEHIVLL